MLYLDTRVKGTKINNTTGKAVVMKHKEYVTGVVTGVLAAALAAGGLKLCTSESKWECSGGFSARRKSRISGETDRSGISGGC